MATALDRAPEIWGVRHGRTLYREEFPDLTDEGVEEVQDTALAVKSEIPEFKRIHLVSSPAARALGTAETFLETVGLSVEVVKTDPDLSPMEMINITEFLIYDRAHRTPREGEMWIRHAIFGSDNPMTESRPKVKTRAFRFLQMFTDMIHAEGPGTLGIFFSHTEILYHYMHALFLEHPEYPIHEHPIPKNAELIRLILNRPTPEEFVVSARGSQRLVRHDVKNSKFLPITA